MECFKPLSAYKTPDGKVKFCHGSLLPPDDCVPFTLPCGQCINCRLARSREWATRIVHESKMHSANAFVTLTYSDDHLPAYRSLVKRDLQLFFKRLRKALSPLKIRYYAVGEYGDLTQRPHYHICLFGTDFSDDRRLYRRRSHSLFESPTLSAAWPFGFANFGDLTFESAAYVARYCLKKQTGEQAVNYEVATDLLTGEIISREPEFAIMSTKPGIGLSWWLKYGSDVIRTDKVIMRGKALKPPRYYDKKMAEYLPIEFDAVRERRVLKYKLLSCRDLPTCVTLERFGRLRKAEHARTLLQSAFKRSYEHD